MNMKTITVSVDEEAEEEFRKIAKSIYNGKKGYLGKAISEALRMWIDARKQTEIANRELEAIKSGFDFGKKLYKTRAELHE